MHPKDIVRQGYDRVSETYRSDSFDFDASEYGEFLHWLETDLPGHSAVLDLGCGCGVPVAQILSKAHRLTGVDISPVQIDRARRLVPDARFICADMAEISFDRHTFDAVISFYAIIHVPVEQQRPLLSRLAGWLKPGGLLLASVGHQAWTGIEQDWCGVRGAMMYWSHADAATYRSWLSRAGFEILREAFVPEGTHGHTVLLAQQTGEVQPL